MATLTVEAKDSNELAAILKQLGIDFDFPHNELRPRALQTEVKVDNTMMVKITQEQINYLAMALKYVYDTENDKRREIERHTIDVEFEVH